MDLINNTVYPALMFRTVTEDETKYASSVCVRVTYKIVNNQLEIAPEQNRQLFTQKTETEIGILESDFVFKRGGVDILVFGNAVSPKQIPVKAMEVEINVKNKLNHKLQVFGNRKWVKSIFGMDISSPETFTTIPLTLENAFGGKQKWDGLEIPHGNNPYGKGYFFDKEAAIGGDLPNIENPVNLIKKWNDNVDPVGFCCLPQCAMNMMGNVDYDNTGKITRFDAKFFNTAFPSMIVNKIEEGDEFNIIGMSLKPLTFIIPKTKFLLKATNGAKIKEWEMYIEQVGVIVDKHEVFITYRYPFNYTFEPMQKRFCEILEQ